MSRRIWIKSRREKIRDAFWLIVAIAYSAGFFVILGVLFWRAAQTTF